MGSVQKWDESVEFVSDVNSVPNMSDYSSEKTTPEQQYNYDLRFSQRRLRTFWRNVLPSHLKAEE
jgi:hypothetical protein